MKKNQGGSSQQRRRVRRAALRAQMNPEAAAAAESADLAAITEIAAEVATAAELAPEDSALERLDASLGEPEAEEGPATTATAANASVRMILPQDAADEVTAFVMSRMRVAAAGDESLDLSAALQERLGEAFTLTNFEFVDAPATRLPEVTPGPAEPEAPAVDNGELHWRSEITFERTLTADGRAFAPDAIDWRDPPLTLGAMLDTPHADMVTEARACGRIDQIWRDGNIVRAEGVFDSGEFGQEIGRMVVDGTLRGVSVDTVIHSYEVGPRSQYFDQDGNWIDQADAPETEEPDLVDMLMGDEGDVIFVITSATIGAVTICPFAAFADAKISVGDSLVAGATPGIVTATQQSGMVVTRHAPEQLTASAVIEVEALAREAGISEPITASAAGLAPLAPPAAWFDNPALEEPTALSIDDEGRIIGHAWLWDTCHIGIPGVCTTAPATATNYAVFHVGEILCEGGERVAVGRITFDTGHAAPGLSRAQAAAHYDDTGKVGAYVVVGEDEHGGWVAGTLAASVTAEDAQKLRGSAPSGDWRNVNGNLELIALLAVNVPGFPVPRLRAELVASGDGFDVVSLTAAGLIFEPSEDALFALGVEDAIRSGDIAEDAREGLLGNRGAETDAAMVERGREALAARRAQQVADLRQIEALAVIAHGAFDDLATAAHEA